MARLTIDFARQPRFVALQCATWRTWAFLFASIFVFGIVAMQVRNQFAMSATLNELHENLVKQTAKHKAAYMVAAPLPIAGEQAKAVNTAINQLNLPWRDVFDNVEAATPENVALLSLEPDANSHVVRILAETRNTDVMIDYVEQLRAQPFSSVCSSSSMTSTRKTQTVPCVSRSTRNGGAHFDETPRPKDIATAV